MRKSFVTTLDSGVKLMVTHDLALKEVKIHNVAVAGLKTLVVAFKELGGKLEQTYNNDAFFSNSEGNPAGNTTSLGYFDYLLKKTMADTNTIFNHWADPDTAERLETV